MKWSKAIAILLAASILAYPVPALTSTAAAAPAQEQPQDYAARETHSQDLEQFSGGWHGVVLTVIVVAALVWLLFEIFDRDDGVHDHHVEPSPARP